MEGDILKIQINYDNLFDVMFDCYSIIDDKGYVIYMNEKMQKNVLCYRIGDNCFLKHDEKLSNLNKALTDVIENGIVNKLELELFDKIYSIVIFPINNKLNNRHDVIQLFNDITYKKQLTNELNYKNKLLTDDINFAKNMQTRMLPVKEIYNGLKLDYIYKPSEMLSGDYFDVFKIDDNRTGIYICDVVGHGVSASLLTMFVRQSVRTLSRTRSNINSIMKELHKMFLSLNIDSDKYFSIFFGIYEKNNKEYYYVNAGQNTVPMVLSDGKIKMLKAKGYPICNLFDLVSYEVYKIDLKIGDKLLFYTDGILEAKNGKNEEFGEEKIKEIFLKNHNILNDIYYDVNNFITEKLKDDCALMLLEVVD